MSLVLQIVMILGCLMLLGYVIRLVKRGRLLLRYSLLWLALAVVVIVCAVFPSISFGLAYALGFVAPSNFIFFAGFFFLLLISLSLSSIASKQALSIKNLVQRLALVEKELEASKARTHSASSRGSRWASGASEDVDNY